MDNLDHLENDYDKAQYLQSTLIGYATNDECGGIDEDYVFLRKYFLDNPNTKKLVLQWVRVNRDTGEYWEFIKHKFSTYAERRKFIWEELNLLMEYCETQQVFPAEKSISEVLQNIDETGINKAWQKALERKSSDPEGAITIA